MLVFHCIYISFEIILSLNVVITGNIQFFSIYLFSLGPSINSNNTKVFFIYLLLNLSKVNLKFMLLCCDLFSIKHIFLIGIADVKESRYFLHVNLLYCHLMKLLKSLSVFLDHIMPPEIMFLLFLSNSSIYFSLLMLLMISFCTKLNSSINSRHIGLN